MIPADLLRELQEADPELWILYTNNDFVGKVSEAWLQHCLQESIRARGWHLYQIRNDDLPGLPCFADIIILGHGKEHDIRNEGEGSTESEALLRAYLAAIHGEKA